MEQDEVRGAVIAADGNAEDDALAGETIIARAVTSEDYLRGKYGRHTEWMNGVVIARSPVSIQHSRLGTFLSDLLRVYLQLTTGGEVLTDPVVMQPSPDLPARQPDLQVVLPLRLIRAARTSFSG